MVSAGMVLGRSMAAVAGGQVMELWYMVSAGMEQVRGWCQVVALPRLLEVR